MDSREVAFFVAMHILLLQSRMFVIFFCYCLLRRDEQVSGKRKRAKGYSVNRNALISMMTSFMNDTNEALAELTKAVNSFTEGSRQVQQVFAAIEKLPDIQGENSIIVALKLVDRPQSLDLFFHLNDEGKSTFVKMILGGLICNE